ncbi:NAD(P)-dependent dehydrogenase (short-subunit alcohol dehydrogenase family) [Prosthecobacter fusiformis]|uniref:NAD(P)-dependent dehydrogenase (Short-subunit alcohol dehydrogenase family) n=1 Tax=Prosthecobacter fusiformis TaxID=48464 RepID=A0A4R7RTH3_9BACT|nr:SDR family oxidoreductase [Prosthecobacter fusiformis]TDU68085.1 NAD(P)-dependent dehydrogenase (short-subunit alcohol dehydrogenase family) [Prosthecobacter fusiformis]
MFSLAHKTAVITGAGSGIGQAIALLFARQGAHVEVMDLHMESAQDTADQIIAEGGSARAVACDVGDHAHVKAVFEEIGLRRPRLDILVNNAGIAHIGTLLTTTEADLDRLYQINVKGLFNCSQAVISRMVTQGGGVVLNMCSIAADMGLADRFAYSMTKGAVLTMTYSIAKDYLAHGIRCNCISPARVHTPFVDGYLARTYPGQEAEMFAKLSAAQPIGRMAQPMEIASLAVYLCSDEAGFITGSAYPIDGGAIHLR